MAGHAEDALAAQWKRPLLWRLALLWSAESVLKLAVHWAHVPRVLEAPAVSGLLVMLALVAESATKQLCAGEALLLATALLLGASMAGLLESEDEAPSRSKAKGPDWLTWRSMASPIALTLLAALRTFALSAAGVDEVAFGWVALVAGLVLWVPAQKWREEGKAAGKELLACLLDFEHKKLRKEECLGRAMQLLEQGACPNIIDPKSKRPCLHIAVGNMYELSPKLVELLLARGANPLAGLPPTQKTALMEACDVAKCAQRGGREGWRETLEAVVDALVQAGAHIDQRDVYKDTVLHLMAHDGIKEICDVLIARGADPRLASENGACAAHWFRRRGWELPGSCTVPTPG